MSTYTIEIATPKNRRVLFHPTQELLRGRWELHNMRGRQPHESISALPEVIPGLRLEIDTSKKTLRIYDPLNEKSHRETWAQIESAYAKYSQYLGRLGRRWDERLITAATPDQIKTWLYWFRRLVDGNKATVVEGASSPLPAMDKINELPGLTRISQFNDQARAPIFREHFDQFGRYLGPDATAPAPTAAGK